MLTKVLFTMSLIGFSFGCVSATAGELTLHDALIGEIVANADQCVMGCTEEKIYLKTDRIIPTEEGLFLNLNGEDHVALPYLYSDQGGCYLAGFGGHLVKTPCPECGVPRVFRCQNPKCPLNKKPGK